MKIRLLEATGAAHRIDALLRERLDGRYPLGSFRALSRAQRDAARRFWSQRAWSEDAAMPGIPRLLLKSVQEPAPLSETAALSAIAQDEALHTRLSQQAAEALGGYVEDVPDDLAYDPY